MAGRSAARVESRRPCSPTTIASMPISHLTDDAPNEDPYRKKFGGGLGKKDNFVDGAWTCFGERSVWQSVGGPRPRQTSLTIRDCLTPIPSKSEGAAAPSNASRQGHCSAGASQRPFSERSEELPGQWLQSAVLAAQSGQHPPPPSAWVSEQLECCAVTSRLRVSPWPGCNNDGGSDGHNFGPASKSGCGQCEERLRLWSAAFDLTVDRYQFAETLALEHEVQTLRSQVYGHQTARANMEKQLSELSNKLMASEMREAAALRRVRELEEPVSQARFCSN